ncbi:MAG: MarC family protein [Lentisphaeria bacterium]|nr:MarC family protein [Lentisphaeria bacterium]
MEFSTGNFVGLIIRLFVLLSPFCTLSLFLSCSGDLSAREQRGFATRISLAIWIICILFYLFGQAIFGFLGITLNAFRVGAGVVLFLNGLDLVRGSGIPKAKMCAGSGDMAVVPMAIPYTVGPATIGVLLLMGANVRGMTQRIAELVAISVVGLLMWLLLIFARRLELVLKEKGLIILGKLTGMYLVALASQIVFEGIRGLMGD